ncbi:MAG: hypothetical protein JXJ22_12320 [Bacteroidales bacterium]|nr:hypothetical protein [Bacteroidales bacterium]
MKKIFLKYSILLVALMVISSCENDPIMFNNSMNIVGFSSTALSVGEGGEGTVILYLGARAGSPGTTITIEVSTDGLSNAATEGADFSVSTKEIPLNPGTETVTVTSVDNDVFTGNKAFYLVITSNTAGYDTSAQDRILITIVDDEHPLKAWIGTYDVEADSYGDVIQGEPDGAWDESWTVTTYADPDDVTILWFSGIAGGDKDVPGTFDSEAGTITFSPGLDLGDPYNNGPTGMYPANDDMLANAGDYITTGIIAACSENNLVGTIDPDGSIHIDMVGLVLENYVYCWDVFNTYWTKQGSTAVMSSQPQAIINKGPVK